MINLTVIDVIYAEVFLIMLYLLVGAFYWDCKCKKELAERIANIYCWHCKSKMIWGCDFSYEDYGLEGEGIVSTFSCSNKECGVTSEVYYPIT